MKIARVQIKNFRNFKALDVQTGDNLVIVGENKVGKTNFLHALRLALDPTLPESSRWLEEKDFWDGLETKISKDVSVEISIDLTGFDGDDNLLAVLAEHIVAVEPLTARLTYAFRPIPGREIKSIEDYEPITYGGDRPENRFGYELRRRIALEVMPALRDAESDLASLRNSPLRRLIEQIRARIDTEQLQQVSDEIRRATAKMLDIPDRDDNTKQPVRNTEQAIDGTKKYHLLFACKNQKAAVLANDVINTVEDDLPIKQAEYAEQIRLRSTGQLPLFYSTPSPEVIFIEKVNALKQSVLEWLPEQTDGQTIHYELIRRNRSWFGTFRRRHLTQVLNELKNEDWIILDGAASKEHTKVTRIK